jgi:glycosyltransferase involved in cell wall biosynthesis
MVIPIYNEEKNISILYQKAINIGKSNQINFIFVENGSKDLSKSVLQDIQNDNCKFVKIIFLEKNMGYGGGILAGLNYATTKYVGWTHADLQTDLEDCILGLNIINKNTNIFVKGLRKKRNIIDNIFSISMAMFNSVVLKKGFWDINAQPTIFTQELLEKFKCPPKDFSLDLYLYYLAKKFDFKIKRFPVKYHERLFGESKWNSNFSSRLIFIQKSIKFTMELKKLK